MKHIKLSPLSVTIARVSAMKTGKGAFPHIKSAKPTKHGKIIDPEVEKALLQRLAELTGETTEAIQESKRKERAKKGYNSLEEALKQMKKETKK